MLFRKIPGIVAIDVPIGLPESGLRECDKLAREMLGRPRRNSVFPVPIRAALDTESREEASEITEAVDERRVSCQSFSIYKKIAEVDGLLRSSSALRKRVFEVHPEVCFWAWNGEVPMKNGKKSEAGLRERRRLVVAEFGTRGQRVIEGLRENPKKDVGDDDILDAFAALWTAKRINPKRSVVLPSKRIIDQSGLPLRIVY